MRRKFLKDYEVVNRISPQTGKNETVTRFVGRYVRLALTEVQLQRAKYRSVLLVLGCLLCFLLAGLTPAGLFSSPVIAILFGLLLLPLAMSGVGLLTFWRQTLVMEPRSYANGPRRVGYGGAGIAFLGFLLALVALVQMILGWPEGFTRDNILMALFALLCGGFGLCLALSLRPVKGEIDEDEAAVELLDA